MSASLSQESPPGAETNPSHSVGKHHDVQSSHMFRREALEYRAAPQQQGQLLHLIPAWTNRAYWLLVAVCTSALIYTMVGRVNEYASGVALIQAQGRVTVTARSAGTVQSVAVHPGQAVRVGQILVHLHAAAETAELHRIERELDLQLVKMLGDPSDSSARSAITSLRAQRELAAARLDERLIRAPHNGRVSDVRIHPGQPLQPGDFVLSLAGEAEGFRVVAMLPGQYRPLLRCGMPLRLQLQGFPYAYQTVSITAVGEEVVGPNEIRRFLGAAASDVFTTEGGVVLVEGHLAGRTFYANGRTLPFYQGMQATAEVQVGSEGIITTVIPALRAIWGHDMGPL